NDTRLDIAVSGTLLNTIVVLLGYGTKGFDSMITFSTGINSALYSLAIGHFNDDNHLDIVVTNSQTDNVAILFGSGNRTFAIGVIYSTGARSQPSAVTVKDLNNDNILDIVIANFGTNSIFFLYGYGNGTFRRNGLYQLGYEYRPTSIVLTDLNIDN
ncbi:unnamed protein product, partial [Rotaria sp. Silwood2]